MEKYIQTMAGHWLQLLISALIVLNTQVHCHGKAMVDFTFLQNAEAKGAVCLDGSPAGYRYSKGSGDGANNWLVLLPGGGWCDTTAECLNRVKTSPGTSSTKNITASSFGGILSPNQTVNPDFYNWNRVSIRYCDGSSFIGDVEEVDPETNLHYRGSRIFSAVIDELLAKGLNNAQNAILAGDSAGALGAILHCDRFRALVPNTKRVKCISDSGFFIRAKDLPNASGREQYFARTIALHGVAKFLPTSCTSRMDPGLCFFPEYLVGNVQTPLFLLNSAFDKYQISVTLKPYPADKPGWQNCTSHTETCTPAQLQIIKEFRNTFLETLKEIGDRPPTGLFISSCYIHDHLFFDSRWNSDGSPRLDNKTIAQAIGDWYFERSVVKLIDTQPNCPVDCHVL
ncbi:hypothetical protein DH2020_005902 [Rehmannia glutinosa]|uniref:Pectin acetylesterase n=1 Tax=Rehmannia glutinosa TaxID=99300 RepID=A0ABR0XHU6_REHGL